MLYIMPAGKWDDYKNKGQQRLLDDAAAAIRQRYPSTEIYADTLVVVIQYQNFRIEAQPVFKEADGSYTYPYAKSGGCWRTTKPQDELDTTSSVNGEKNGNLRLLARMARAWRNKHGVAMGGLLIDTLAHNFLVSTTAYDNTAYGSCCYMMRDFLAYLADQPNQDRYAALGSGQHVKVYKKFQSKAKKGLELTKNAIEAGEEEIANNRWRKVFGRGYPYAVSKTVARQEYIYEGSYEARNTEEFVEDRFPVDVRYLLRLDCEVKQSGFRTFMLRASRAVGIRRLPVPRSKSLRFYVDEHNIPGVFHLYWKVLNRGRMAIERDMIRGQIEADRGSRVKHETSNFRGEHVVDCYAVKNGVVVAKDRIHVPIMDEGES